MHYVYILTSTKDPSKHYIGTTINLKIRIQEHNRGKLVLRSLGEAESGTSKRYAQWQLKTYVGFSDKD